MDEKINLYIVGKRFAGSSMKLFFGNRDTKSAQKVLIFHNLIAFSENEVKNINNYVLQTREGSSVYGLDMSLRFNKPEYATYIETFLFVNEEGPNIAFRALSAKVGWWDLDKLPPEDLHY